MTHNICFILLAVDKENNNDPLKIWGLYLFVLAFPGECVNQLGSEVKSIPERSAGWFKTLDVWHRLMLCAIKKIFFIDMKFGINQAISQTITQLSCIQLETPSSRLWIFWWIKTYTTFKLGSPNLDQRCKRPWLRALLFCGMIDRDLQGQIEPQSQNLPHFELVHAITHHQLKLQFPNLEQTCILPLFKSLPILGLIEIDLQFNF